jgi:isoquinoline 1-oxidoreductase beta subunit
MQIDRRRFITWSAGGALMLSLGPVAASATDEALNPWISIAADGKVTLYSTVSEMGQGARTGQAQVLADELDVPWDRVSVEMAPDAPPFSTGGFGLATGGSGSIRLRYAALRQAGATARAQLVSAAAKRWSCPTTDCAAEQGMVRHMASGAQFSYGELAAEAASAPPPANPPLKDAAQRTLIGKPIPTLENVSKTRGQATYGIDVRMPGMLHASIRHPPVYGGKLAAVDPAPAMAVPGVIKVVKLDQGVAVIANSTWTAFQALKALDPQWTAPDKTMSQAEIMAALDATLGRADGVKPSKDAAAQVAATLADPKATKVSAVYQTAYLAHAAMEPMNTTVQISADKVEVWSPTQVPSRVRHAVAQALNRPVEQVVLHNTLLGGGFGRRLQADYAVEAALVAREADGAPVQLTWRREEDTAHDFYRKAVRTRYTATLGDGGLIAACQGEIASTDDLTGGMDLKPYGDRGFALIQAKLVTGVPQGPWRSVDDGLTAFGRESFIDECAHAAKIDPVEYRRRLVGDNPRVLRLVNAAADSIDWAKPRPANTGRGFALIEAFGTLVATGVEVEVKAKKIAVKRIVIAADLGTVVNPQQVRAQLEGGATMGVSAALGEAMTFTGGKADQQSFDTYKVLRMRQAPKVEVMLFDTPDATLGGAGEPGVPGIAPAIAGAVFEVTATRLRTLPFAAQGYSI